MNISLVPWYLLILIFAVLFLLENYNSSFVQTNNIPGQTLNDTFRNPCSILITTMFHLPLISNFLSFRTCTACFAFWFGSWSLDSAAGGYFLHWCITHNCCCVSFKNFLEIFQGTLIKIVRNFQSYIINNIFCLHNSAIFTSFFISQLFCFLLQQNSSTLPCTSLSE